MQTVVSRQTDISRWPAVVSVGAIKGGIRFNIIPDTVEMLGTIRTFDPAVRDDVIARVRNVAEHVATANGATATLEILPVYPGIANDLTTRRMLPFRKGGRQGECRRDPVRRAPRTTLFRPLSVYCRFDAGGAECRGGTCQPLAALFRRRVVAGHRAAGAGERGSGLPGEPAALIRLAAAARSLDEARGARGRFAARQHVETSRIFDGKCVGQAQAPLTVNGVAVSAQAALWKSRNLLRQAVALRDHPGTTRFARPIEMKLLRISRPGR
jgi:hypothetical protein